MYEKFREATPTRLYLWSIKFGAAILSIRNNLYLRKHDNHKSFSWYNASVETNEHFFHCQHAEVESTFTIELGIIYDYLHATTSIEIRDSILRLFHTFQDNIIPFDSTDYTLIQEECRKQHHMGIRATLNGAWNVASRKVLRPHPEHQMSRTMASPPFGKNSSNAVEHVDNKK